MGCGLLAWGVVLFVDKAFVNAHPTYWQLKAANNFLPLFLKVCCIGFLIRVQLYLISVQLYLGGLDMEVLPALSRGETQVLKAVWGLGKGSVGEIHSAVPSALSMDYSTVQTYIRRLLTKGYVSAARVGRNKIYRAAVRKNQVVGDAVEEFLDRMFDGQVLPMVRYLVDNREVTAEEIEDLLVIVESLRAERQPEQ